MFWAKRLGDPYNLLGSDTSRIGNDLAKVRVVSFLKLVLNYNLPITISTKNVKLKVTNPMLCSNFRIPVIATS